MELGEQRTTPSPFVPALFFALLLLLHGIGEGVLMARGVESAALDSLYRVGLLWCLVWWLRADGRRRGVQPVYCLGMLVMVGSLILLPYHLFRTRGAAGLLLTQDSSRC